MDTHGITAIDITRDIVTAIDIVDVTTLNQHTGRIAGRVVSTVDGLCRNGHLVRIHIGHTAAAKNIVDHQILGHDRLYLQQDTVRTGHGALVTAAVEVTDNTFLQIPYWTDGHRCLVVAAKDTGKVEGKACQIALEGCQFHLRLQVFLYFLHGLVVELGPYRHCFLKVVTRVVDVDRRVCRHRRIVTAAIDMGDTAAFHFQIRLP